MFLESDHDFIVACREKFAKLEKVVVEKAKDARDLRKTTERDMEPAMEEYTKKKVKGGKILMENMARANGLRRLYIGVLYVLYFDLVMILYLDAHLVDSW